MSLILVLVFIVDFGQAVFTTGDWTKLNDAVDACLAETADGSCPIFAASNDANDATGNPHGVIGDWDVSKVESLQDRKCSMC